MTRTRQQRIRRAGLADAAAGFDPPYGRIRRVGVVLHCRDLRNTSTLRRYAEARDWQVTAEASGWTDVEMLLEATDAQGVVTDHPENLPAAPLRHGCPFIVAIEVENGATANV
ncbi:hypothetical protein ACWDR0_16115 [Streptomyces sp. NPDC003691]